MKDGKFYFAHGLRRLSSWSLGPRMDLNRASWEYVADQGVEKNRERENKPPDYPHPVTYFHQLSPTP